MRNKKHLQIEKQEEMILLQWLFNGSIENKIEKLYNPKPVKQIAREKIRVNDNQLNKELDEKRIFHIIFLMEHYKLD